MQYHMHPHTHMHMVNLTKPTAGTHYIIPCGRAVDYSSI